MRFLLNGKALSLVKSMEQLHLSHLKGQNEKDNVFVSSFLYSSVLHLLVEKYNTEDIFVVKVFTGTFFDPVVLPHASH
jgi:hypothetical protein